MRRFTAPGRSESGRTTLRRYLTRELPAELAWCVGVAVILTLLLSPFWIDGTLEQWLMALYFNTIISLSIGLTVSQSLRLLMPLVRRRFEGSALVTSAKVAIGLVATTVGVEIAVRIVERLQGMRAESVRPDVLRIGLVVVVVILAIDIGYEKLRERARRDEMHAEQARKEALRAELKALQARTNPHFLFNSLNTVAGLIDDDPRAAEQMLERLADLFRYALNSAEVGWVRLGDELDAVRGYLEVESIRLGERLRFDIDLDGGLLDELVPPLVLQPLVENAVQHAIAPRREGGRLWIRGERRDSVSRLIVEDDGGGLAAPGDGNGTGSSLRELRERLGMLYGDGASLELATGGAGGVRATLVLPRGGGS